jgi:hypothetical protein
VTKSDRLGMTSARAVEHLDVEAAQQRGDPGPDAAQTHDPDHRAAQLTSEQLAGLPAAPPPRAHQALSLPQPARGRQHQGDGELRGRIGQHVGSVRHHHPARAARVHVDVVVADGEVGHHAQPRTRGVEQRGVDRHGRVCDQRGGSRNPAQQLLSRRLGAVLVDVEALR